MRTLRSRGGPDPRVRGPRAGRARPRAGHAGRGLHAAGRHAVDQGRRDDLHGLHLPGEAQGDGRRRQHGQPERVQRRRAPTSTSPATSRTCVAFRITPDITRETGHGQLAERQPHVPPQVRLRAVQPGRLDAQGLVGAPRHPADAVGRLRGERLPLPLPGHDLRDREGYLVSSDAGALVPLRPSRATTATCTSASTTARPTTKPETNDQKAIQIRGTLRPLPGARDAPRPARHRPSTTRDSYVQDGERTRFIGAATFEHKYVNAALRVPGHDGPDIASPAPKWTATGTRSG